MPIWDPICDDALPSVTLQIPRLHKAAPRLPHSKLTATMKINDTLAKGLCSRFFNEMNDHIENDIFKVKRNSNAKLSRAGWKRLIQNIDKDLGNASLVKYEGGGTRNPYFGFCGLNLQKEREYNTWHEKCLSGIQIFINFDRDSEICHASFNVGEHAIARMIERGSFNLQHNNDFNVFGILPGLSQVPLWAAFWSRFLYICNFSNNDLGAIRPIIPSSHGLFLCEIGQNDWHDDMTPIIEIRTFIGTDSLSNEQAFVRSQMLSAGSYFSNSPLALFPLVQAYQLDDPGVLEMLLHYRLIDHFSHIANLLCSDIESSSARSSYKMELIDSSNRLTKECSPSLRSLLDRLGIRQFQKIVRAEMLKNNSV